MGLEGAELKQFVREEQQIIREERQKERDFKRETFEIEKLRLMLESEGQKSHRSLYKTPRMPNFQDGKDELDSYERISCVFSEMLG